MRYRPPTRRERATIRKRPGMYVGAAGAAEDDPRGTHHMLDFVVSELLGLLTTTTPAPQRPTLHLRLWPDRYALTLDTPTPLPPAPPHAFFWPRIVDALSVDFHLARHDALPPQPVRHTARCVPDPSLLRCPFDLHLATTRAREIAAFTPADVSITWQDEETHHLTGYTCADHLRHLSLTHAHSNRPLPDPTPLVALDTRAPLGDDAMHVQLIALPTRHARGAHFSFVNTVPTRGGVHLDGALQGLQARGLDPDALDLLVHVRHPSPRFANPVCEILQNPEVAPLIHALLSAPPAPPLF